MRNQMDMDPIEIIIAMKRANVSQADIARDVGVTRQSVNLIVHGRATSHRIRQAIADAIHKDIKWIWPSAYLMKGGPVPQGRPKSDHPVA